MAAKRRIKENSVKVGRYLAKLNHQGTLRVFLSWIDYVDWRHGGRNLMTRTIMRIVNAKVNHALITWKMLLVAGKRRDENRINLARFAARIKYSGVLRVFNAWLDFFDWRIRGKALLVRMLKRLDNSRYGSVMFAWKRYNLEIRVQQQKSMLIKRFAAKMKYREAFKVFSSWLDFIVWRQSSKDIMNCIILRIANADMSEA